MVSMGWQKYLAITEAMGEQTVVAIIFRRYSKAAADYSMGLAIEDIFQSQKIYLLQGYLIGRVHYHCYYILQPFFLHAFILTRITSFQGDNFCPFSYENIYNNRMDIEEQSGVGGESIKNRSSSLNGHRVSMKSRKSNESCFSIGGTHYYDHPNPDTQKMSLESNISAKAKQKFNNRDLFEHLTYDDPYAFDREEGSLRPRGRGTEGMVEQGGMWRGEEKMSVQGVGVTGAVAVRAEVSCKCPKSKCLLMYCECFSRDTLCNEKCSCYQCRNNLDFQQKRQKARRAVLEKDPNAFTNKLQVIGGQQSQLALKRGCNCKKTNCSKKYCECFFTGVKCTYLCNCENCHNGGANTNKSS